MPDGHLIAGVKVNSATAFFSLLTRLFAEDGEQGQTLIEYGLIIALVSIVAIVTLATVGTNLQGIFSAIAGKLHS